VIRSLFFPFVAVVALAVNPGSAAAQDSSTAIRPGMSEADVRARWGEPIAVKRANDWTYLFYSNGNERHVGWYDTVFLQGGQVVDCIARAPGHVYEGQSSSPGNRTPERTAPAQPGDGAGAVTGIRVTP
jgi:outer membrane protein assembly factor BamE (lipoprotein component of BamABCDE complex)